MHYFIECMPDIFQAETEAEQDKIFSVYDQIEANHTPFKDYFAIDLLKDLVHMYSWRMQKGYSYPISEFLTLCNDAHAEAYRAIYEA